MILLLLTSTCSDPNMTDATDPSPNLPVMYPSRLHTGKCVRSDTLALLLSDLLHDSLGRIYAV